MSWNWIDFWTGWVAGIVMLLAALELFRRLGKTMDEWQPPKMYRIEGGPADNRFLALYPDGMVILCANAGSLPIEERSMSWDEARKLRDEQD